MFLYLIFVYAHIIGIIAWIGYTLFWFLMVPPLSTEFEEREGDRLIKKIDNSNWPPDAIASPLRLKFHKLGWIILTVTIVTGLILLYLRGFGMTELTSGRILTDGLGRLGIGKVVLVAIITVIELFKKRRSVNQVRFVFGTSLLIVGSSVLLVR